MSAYFDPIQILFSILEEGSKKGRHQIKKKTRCILNITKKYVLKITWSILLDMKSIFKQNGSDYYFSVS